jgi:hypothetical protein
MPLSTPVARSPAHTRRVQCQGFRRDDGLWDIEGHLVDTKAYDIPAQQHGGRGLAAGEPLHEMWIRLTVDLDLRIHEVEVCTDAGPYAGCGAITPNFEVLKGLVIKSGWTQKTRELLGGTRGCTHLVELLGPVATTAFQTIYAAREQAKPSGSDGRRPGLIDTCHMYAADGQIVRLRWPEWSTAHQAGNRREDPAILDRG